jgi:hypothetical protein
MKITLIHDFEATWWRGKMVLKEEGLIEPQGPVQPYNPFEVYKPYGRGNRGESRSLLYEFLKLKPQRPLEVLSFCERFGVLGPSEEKPNFDYWAVNEIEDDPAPWGIGAALNSKFGPNVRDPSAAMEPMTLRDFWKAHEDVTKAVAAAKAAAETRGEEARKERLRFSRICNFKLKLARPRLNWDIVRNRWRVGWQIGSLEAAIYLMLAFDVQSDGSILTCPRCGQFFLSEYPRTKFCTPRCLNANKQKTFRERRLAKKKEESQ